MKPLKQLLVMIAILMGMAGCHKSAPPSSPERSEELAAHAPLTNAPHRPSKYEVCGRAPTGLSKQENHVADISLVRAAVQDVNTDPRLMTPPQLRLWALDRLKITALDLSAIPSDGPLSERDAANLLLSREVIVNTAVLARLDGLTVRFLQGLVEELRNLTAITSGDYTYFLDDRLRMLYEFLARADRPTDIRLDALCNLSQNTHNSQERMHILSSAIDVSRGDEAARHYYAPFTMMVMHYKETGDYGLALHMCDEMIRRLQAEPADPRAASLRGKFLEDKVLCLSALGRNTEAQAVLDNAKTRNDVSAQFRQMFNSAAFEEEVRAYADMK